MDTHEKTLARPKQSGGRQHSAVVFNFAQFFSSRIGIFFCWPALLRSFYGNWSFIQAVRKSNGEACKSPLHYRALSHNQTLEIDRLKQVQRIGRN
jgi:hypothetical protein